MEYENFNEMFMKVLDSYAPTKQRVVRGNNQPFMNKVLSRAFIHRTKLKNVYNKNPTELNKNNEIFVLVYSQKKKRNNIIIWN